MERKYFCWSNVLKAEGTRNEKKKKKDIQRGYRMWEYITLEFLFTCVFFHKLLSLWYHSIKQEEEDEKKNNMNKTRKGK